ncbi:RNA polymerase sigma-70 factor [Flavitalea flava]
MISAWQKGIQASNLTSFNDFFRHYYSKLVRFAIQFVHTREAAEEIVSDVFVKIWEKRATLLEVRNLEVYVYVSVKNGCLNYCEKYSVVHLQLDTRGEMEFYDTGNSQKSLEMKELMHRLHMAIEQLPEQCRLIFKMVKEDNLKFHEVAEILNISTRTVETQIYRAVKKLRIVLSDQVSRTDSDNPADQPDQPGSFKSPGPSDSPDLSIQLDFTSLLPEAIRFLLIRNRVKFF